jgi:hypothetical protein
VLAVLWIFGWVVWVVWVFLTLVEVPVVYCVCTLGALRFL